MRRLAAVVTLAFGCTLLGAQCGSTVPKCPVGYVAQQHSGSWGCYPARS